MSEPLPPRSRLLVSVRSAAEAVAALVGGADLIDVKEPTRGSLGRADDAAINAVLNVIASRRPVSAALGELGADDSWSFHPHRLSFAKWGLAGWGRQPAYQWQEAFQRAAASLREHTPCCQPVIVAYADAERAAAPPPAAVAAFARATGCLLLVDTHTKDGSTLLDWLSWRELAALCELGRNAGIRLALAGALTPAAISRLTPLRPDWFAVRGAACRQGWRDGAIDPERVCALQALLHADPQLSESPP